MPPILLTIALLVAPLPVLVGQSAPVCVRTTDAGLASRVVMLLQSAVDDEITLFDLPERPERGHFVVTLDADAKLGTTTGEGTPYLEVALDPGALLGMFEDEVETGRIRMRAVLGMAYSAVGLDYDDVALIVDAVLAFPKQVARCRISMPDAPAESGNTDVRVDLVPVPGTWFARLVDALESPEATDVPVVDAEGAPLRGFACVDLAKAYAVFEPAFAPFAAAWARGPEEREQAIALTRRAIAVYDGRASMTIDAEGRLCALMGLADPDAHRELMRDPAYVEQQRRAGSAGGQAEVTIEPGAFEHRGVALDRLTIESDNPMMNLPWSDADGKMITHVGIAGSCLVSSAGHTAAARSAIDAALDPEAHRVEMPRDTFLKLEMKFAELYETFAAGFAPDGAAPTLPRDVSLTVRKDQSTLSFEVTFR